MELEPIIQRYNAFSLIVSIYLNLKDEVNDKHSDVHFYFSFNWTSHRQFSHDRLSFFILFIHNKIQVSHFHHFT